MAERESKFKCPLCDGPLTLYEDASGVLLTCYNPCLPTIHENVFGHGSNEKNAYENACQKFKKSQD